MGRREGVGMERRVVEGEKVRMEKNSVRWVWVVGRGSGDGGRGGKEDKVLMEERVRWREKEGI